MTDEQLAELKNRIKRADELKALIRRLSSSIRQD